MCLLFKIIFLCFTTIVTTNLNASGTKLKTNLASLVMSMEKLKTNLAAFSTKLADLKTSLDPQWTDEDQQVLQKIKDAKLITENIRSKKFIKIKPGQASNCLRILFIDTDTSSYVVKELPYYAPDHSPSYKTPYELEMALVSQVDGWNKILQDFATANNVKVPKLVRYYGGVPEITLSSEEKVSAIVMEKAPGESLMDIRDRFDQFSEQQAKEIAQAIGEQMGASTRAFFKHNKKILVLGDSEPQNLLYDYQEKQLYIIDLPNTYECDYNPADPFQGYLSGESRMVYSSIYRSFYDHIDPTELEELKEKKETSGMGAFYFYKIKYLAATTFYNAYYAQVKDLTPVKDCSGQEQSFVTSINKHLNRDDPRYPGVNTAIKRAFKDDPDNAQIISYLGI